jgi:hypothetical protein
VSAQPGERLRIGDAERERAQSLLGDHYAAGRLDHDEYTQRLDQIWAARTRAELDPVFVDLPGERPVASAAYPFSTPASRRPTAPTRRRGPRLPLPLLVLLVVLGSIAVMTHLPWILIGVGVWVFFLRGGACHPRSVHTRRW